MKRNYQYDELTTIALENLLYTMHTPKGMYKYDDYVQMETDFIMFFYKGTRQKWWCDGVYKRMIDAKRLTDEYVENHL